MLLSRRFTGPFTVLAPTNEAFGKLDQALLEDLLQPENQEYLQEILLYHMLPGYLPSLELQSGSYETLVFGFDVEVTIDPSIRFDDAGLIRPDTNACNGIIHMIDDVLVPAEPDFCDPFTFDERRRLQDGGENCMPNLLETAAMDAQLSTVVSLIKAADLDEVFFCPGPFTGLLPNNAAFEALDPAYLEFLLDPANLDDLQDLLLYHILPGATTSTEFTAGLTETLLLGETVDVGVSPLTFDEANVITADIPACNAFIDVLDTVLTPFPIPVAEEPTLAPTVPPTPESICDEYTFDRRVRQLQDGGELCSNNVLETASQNPDLSLIVTMIEVAELAPIFSCAGKSQRLV